MTFPFKVGDLVRIKRTNVPMTVDHLFKTDIRDVNCIWFDKRNQLQTARFNHMLLEVVPEAERVVWFQGTPEEIAANRQRLLDKIRKHEPAEAA